MRPNAPETSDIPISDEQRTAIRAALEQLLSSPAFRNSKQSQRFLRYVVEHSLHGKDDQLKERNIGIEVFERVPDYDTGEDPIVRVRATEIRKRLAQYYQEGTDSGAVRIELRSGSYRAEFHFAPPPAEILPVRAGKLPTMAIGIAVLLCLIVGGIWATRMLRPAGVLEQFWAPVMTNTKPVLIYCGQPVVYFLSRDVHEAYKATNPSHQRGSTPVLLNPDTVLHGRDIIPVTEQFVGIGNAHAAVLLSTMFAGRGKPVELRYANDLSFSDLRSSPAVLIGAFSNLWTLEMTGKLRFVFEQDQGQRRIMDTTNKQSWSLKDLAPDGKTPEDYAIVSRLFDSATGQTLVSAAGITQYGTRAAGEFLTDSERMNQALEKAPADWPKRNIQVLLHTTVYKGTPARPTVAATHVW
ncbi:hypothetical protein [Paludibaculum fermentans]|uniref:Adenylate cyclase n=1 Tax=Paludibaculum fermentans TaxID=1473598 RepID=A0A7S7NQM9_PALFE|nr:hypothetical protein [Paludibaculum fermentans]QOY87973.1 hypothetical protein IRI77_35435 [Paludibaculum fermentans]